MGLRDHDYWFTHRFLRDAFYQNPSAFIEQSNSARRAQAERLWEKCTIEYSRQIQRTLPSGGLSVIPIERSPYTGTLYRMPKAVGFAEAIMICALRQTSPQRGERPVAGNPKYFTLENGEDAAGDRRTVLCLWDVNGGHHNFGDGPNPAPEAFVQACIDTFPEADRLIKRFYGEISRWLEPGIGT